MRKNQEINKAVAILRKKGDLISLEQASELTEEEKKRRPGPGGSERFNIKY